MSLHVGDAAIIAAQSHHCNARESTAGQLVELPRGTKLRGLSANGTYFAHRARARRKAPAPSRRSAAPIKPRLLNVGTGRGGAMKKAAPVLDRGLRLRTAKPCASSNSP